MANKPEISMDADALYREEVYTDRRMGTIRVLHPVDVTGAADAGRQTLYVGEAQLLTPMGTLPLSFELPGDSLQAAVQAFPSAAEGAVGPGEWGLAHGASQQMGDDSAADQAAQKQRAVGGGDPYRGH